MTRNSILDRLRRRFENLVWGGNPDDPSDDEAFDPAEVAANWDLLGATNTALAPGKVDLDFGSQHHKDFSEILTYAESNFDKLASRPETNLALFKVLMATPPSHAVPALTLCAKLAPHNETAARSVFLQLLTPSRMPESAIVDAVKIVLPADNNTDTDIAPSGLPPAAPKKPPLPADLQVLRKCLELLRQMHEKKPEETSRLCGIIGAKCGAIIDEIDKARPWIPERTELVKTGEADGYTKLVPGHQLRLGPIQWYTVMRASLLANAATRLGNRAERVLVRAQSRSPEAIAQRSRERAEERSRRRASRNLMRAIRKRFDRPTWW